MAPKKILCSFPPPGKAPVWRISPRIGRPNFIDQIGDTIKMLRQEGKMSILLVERYPDFCKELTGAFAIMDRGAIVSAGPISALTDEVGKKQHLYRLKPRRRKALKDQFG